MPTDTRLKLCKLIDVVSPFMCARRVRLRAICDLLQTAGLPIDRNTQYGMAAGLRQAACRVLLKMVLDLLHPGMGGEGEVALLAWGQALVDERWLDTPGAGQRYDRPLAKLCGGFTSETPEYKVKSTLENEAVTTVDQLLLIPLNLQSVNFSDLAELLISFSVGPAYTHAYVLQCVLGRSVDSTGRVLEIAE